MLKEKILLFIPVYNCENQITRVLSQCDSEILSYIDEIIIVNNISTDNTEKITMAYLRRHPELPAKLLRNDENYGLGGSHKTAFEYAINRGFDYVIVLHGDDQGNIRDLLPVLQEKKYQRYDCSLGARFKKGSRLKGYSKFRTFGNIVYNALFSIVLGRVIYDLGAGLNMFKVDRLKNKYYLKFPDNLTFNYCITLAITCYRHTFMFFPISWREEDQVSNVKITKQAFSVLSMLFSYFFKRAKYLETEFRTVPRARYTFQVIYDAAG